MKTSPCATAQFLSMNRTLTRPAATLSHRMGEGLGVRAFLKFSGSIRQVLLGRILSVIVATLGLLSTSTPAWAHPGHGWRDHHASHYLTSPYHLLALAVSGAALWAAAWCVRQVPARRWLQYLGGGAMVLAAALWLVRF